MKWINVYDIEHDWIIIGAGFGIIVKHWICVLSKTLFKWPFANFANKIHPNKLFNFWVIAPQLYNWHTVKHINLSNWQDRDLIGFIIQFMLQIKIDHDLIDSIPISFSLYRSINWGLTEMLQYRIDWKLKGCLDLLSV